MDERYSFDEEKKRFKPISKICIYCNGVKTDNDDTNFYIKLYKEKKRLNLFIYRNVKYSSIEIGIPRCSPCKKIHEKVELDSKIIFLGFLILMTTISFIYPSGIPQYFSITVLLIDFIFFLLFFAGDFSFKYFLPIKYLQKRLIKKHKILAAIDSAKKDKTIEDCLSNGWTINEPNP
ncbi:MAG: hypothetical protein KGO81_09190 [Bacteroidota bacterium]|nr:hypothetical protein [Bacteroidota bacterium]